MEVYAGFSSTSDHHVGRLVDAARATREPADDTLNYYIIGDNGAPPRARSNGCFNEMATLNGMAGIETPEFLLSKIDQFGGPERYNHYAVGWAHAMDTPYPVDEAGRLALGRHAQRHDRPLAEGHQGEGRDPLQFHHVIDVAPTILEAPACRIRPIVHSTRAGAVRGRQHAVRVQRREGGGAPRDAVLRDVLQTAASTTRAGPR
jgi:arylsulfatase